MTFGIGIFDKVRYHLIFMYILMCLPQTHYCGRRSPAVACWASDHWVASSNPLRGKFRH